MGYFYLTIAIAGELAGTTCLKYAAGFTKLLPTLGCIVFYVVSFYCMSRCLNYISLSITYATWSVVGIVVTTILSVFLFRETLTRLGILGLILIIAGVILLNLFGSK